MSKKPSFETIVATQSAHQQRMKLDRSPAERNSYERSLQPVTVSTVELPRVPMVRLKTNVDNDTRRWALIGEISQLPGKVILVDIVDGSVNVQYTTDQLVIVPPSEYE